MNFTRDPTAAVSIRRIERGRVRIGDATYERTLAVTAESVLADWEAPALRELTIDELEPLLETDPEIVVLGTGFRPALPPRELTFALARRGIGFESMDTPAAARTFNILVAEGRRPVAILMMD